MGSPLTTEQIVASMKAAKHLSTANEAILRTAISQAAWHTLPSRKVLMRQGEQQDSVYFLLSGKLHYERVEPNGKIVISGEVKPGELLGDVSLLHDQRAVGTVFAVRDSQLLSLDWPTFKALLLGSPESLMSITAKILKQAEHGLAHTGQTKRFASIAIIALDEGIDLNEFSERLRIAFSHHGKAGVLNRQRFEAALGRNRADLNEDDPGFFENLNWLSQYAQEHEFVLFQTDFTPTPWSRQCLRQADRILLVAKNISEKKLTGLEKYFFDEQSEFSPKAELVILRGEHPVAKGTAEFYESRLIARHHHLNSNGDEEFLRLVSKLLGRSIGVALGGGGIRALAQIGVLRAFVAANIPVDLISGTSIGSLIGALFAKGISPQDMEQIVAKHVVHTNLFNDYVPPLVSLVRGKKFSQFIRKIIGEDCIEDLPHEYFAVATNLTSGTLEIFDRGPAWQAVRASASLPGILPPYAANGHLYLDGGLMDNLPSEPLRQRGAGKVVAVDVSGPQRGDADKNFAALVADSGTLPSLWPFIGNKFLRRSTPQISIGDVIVRSMVVGSRERSKHTQATADLYIRMPVDDWKMMDFKKGMELVELGYRYASEQLPEWQKILTTDKSADN